MEIYYQTFWPINLLLYCIIQYVIKYNLKGNGYVVVPELGSCKLPE